MPSEQLPSWRKHAGLSSKLSLFDDPQLYDAVFAWDVDAELSLIKRHLKPDASLIEYGCGSGRLLVPLLQDGYRIDGVDISYASASRISQKLLKSAPYRPVIVIGDFSKTVMLKSYDAALAGLNTLRYLKTAEQVLNHFLIAALNVRTDGFYFVHLETRGDDSVATPIGEFGEWRQLTSERQTLDIKWQLVARANGLGFDTETEEVTITNKDTGTCTVEQQLQLAATLRVWQETIEKNGHWILEQVWADDGSAVFNRATWNELPPDNYWLMLRRTNVNTSGAVNANH